MPQPEPELRPGSICMLSTVPVLALVSTESFKTF